MTILGCLSFPRVTAAAIFSAGVTSLLLRYTKGLAAVTNLTDTHPWGLWFGLNVLCGVALAIGGFAVAGGCYLLRVGRLRSVARLAATLASVSYLCAGIMLEIELGRPWLLWSPRVMFNPLSPTFVVPWALIVCAAVPVLAYWDTRLTTTQFSNVPRALRIANPLLCALGLVLIILHQLSLAGLFVVLAGRMHPLWCSPLLPIHFVLSAAPAGLAVLIFAANRSGLDADSQANSPLRHAMACNMALLALACLLLRFADLRWRGELHEAFAFRWSGAVEVKLFWLEILLWLLPLAVFLKPAGGPGPRLVQPAAVSMLAALLTNRLNVSITGMDSAASSPYVPSWMEMAVAVAIAGLGGFLFKKFSAWVPWIRWGSEMLYSG